MGIKEKTISGFLWSLGGTLGSGILNFILTIILARLIKPAEFGSAELLIIFIAISATFVDSGFSQALIRDKNATQKDLSSVFFLNVFISILIYLILFLSAPYLAKYFNSPNLLLLARFAFLTIIIEAFAIIQNTNLSRELNFKPYTQASLIAVIIAGIVAVIMAFENYGIWALVTYYVLLSLIRTLFLWIKSNWKPSLIFRFSSINKYLKFGSNLLIQGIIDRIVTNLESITIGKFYRKEDLGFFSQARKIDHYLTRPLVSIVQKVSYPSLSKLDEKQLKLGYKKVLGFSMFIVIPFAFFVLISAENLVNSLLGPQWQESISYLRLWSIIGAMVATYSIFTNIFLVKGKSRQLLVISGIRQILRISSVIIFVRISVIAMTWGIVMVTFISCFLYLFYGGRLINYSLREIFYDLFPIIILSLISSLIVISISYLFKENSYYLIFLIQIFLMLISYVGLNIATKNEIFFEIKNIVNTLFIKIKI